MYGFLVEHGYSEVLAIEIMNVQSRIYELRTQLHQANVDYHVFGQPTITDVEFDQLFRELLTLEKSNPQFHDVNSPTARVGAGSIASFSKTKHNVPMLSLDNAFTAEEVVDFFPHVSSLIVEPKIDGLSLSVRYTDGRLIQAVTRGDGTEGDDVTANVRAIHTVPLIISYLGDLEIRGEVYMPKSQFDRLNAEREQAGDELFANARNAASGTLKLKDSSEVSKRKLAFVAYQVIGLRVSIGFDTHHGTLCDLDELGFSTPETAQCVAELINVKGAIAALSGRRPLWPFDVDGLVFKIDDLRLREELGLGTRSPKWAVAYKFPPEQKTTKLRSISVQVGRTGTLTPVAELEPVQLGGTTVQRASLCNQDEIDRLGVGIGDTVIVVKSAEIIPKVIGVKEKHAVSVWKMPAACPICGTAVAKDAGMVAYYCPNYGCSEQVYCRLEHALSKRALDWDGMGEATIRKMLRHRPVNNLMDIFKLTDVSFLGTAMNEKFWRERTRVMSAPLWRKFNAFGIEGVGQTMCKELAARWPSLKLVCEQGLTGLSGVIGPVAAKSFLDYVSQHAVEISGLESIGYLGTDNVVNTGSLSGKVFVITGTMMSGSRDQVTRRIEEAGGLVKSSVSKKVHYLVKGENSGNNKTQGAERCRTAVITEEELYELLGQPMPVAPVAAVEIEY